MPFVSIITITYQAGQFIERTLKSIEKQTDDDFELIVIDGLSTDQTLPLLDKYAYLVHKLISERDEGIYDAMNKGLEQANGRFVWFVNAGDEIAGPDILSGIKSAANSKTDLIYGDAFFVNAKGKIRGKRSDITPHKLHDHIEWQDLKRGMLVCHQSLLVLKELAPKYISNNLSADLDWEIECFKRAKSKLFIPYPISNYLEGGVSNQRWFRSLADRFRVLQKHFGFTENLMNHCHILIRGVKLFIIKWIRY